MTRFFRVCSCLNIAREFMSDQFMARREASHQNRFIPLGISFVSSRVSISHHTFVSFLFVSHHNHGIRVGPVCVSSQVLSCQFGSSACFWRIMTDRFTLQSHSFVSLRVMCREHMFMSDQFVLKSSCLFMSQDPPTFLRLLRRKRKPCVQNLARQQTEH